MPAVSRSASTLQTFGNSFADSETGLESSLSRFTYGGDMMFLSATRKISPHIGSSVDRDSSPLADAPPHRRSKLQTDEILG
jgi:hypothetical protein